MKYEKPFPETKGGCGNQQPMKAYLNGSLAGCVHHPVEMASQDTSASSQAIVPVAPSEDGALAIVPLCKPRPSDIGLRRTRRPFTVGEVEVLVEAVELIGTGRSVSNKFVSVDANSP